MRSSQENFAAQLQVEKEKTKLLQEELEGVKGSYYEDCLKFETELSNVKQ